MKKWYCKVIYTKGIGYRAIMEINGITVNGLPCDVDYNTLKQAILLKTGIVILKRKDMIFEKLSDFEQVATIDNTQVRNDCRVTIAELINGYEPRWV